MYCCRPCGSLCADLQGRGVLCPRVPATYPASDAVGSSPVPGVEGTEPASEAVGADVPVFEIHEDHEDFVEIIEPSPEAHEGPDFVVHTPEGLKDFEVHTPVELLAEPSADVHYKETSSPKGSHDRSPGDPPANPVSQGTSHMPFDHLLCHQPASRHCDVCRQACTTVNLICHPMWKVLPYRQWILKASSTWL